MVSATDKHYHDNSDGDFNCDDHIFMIINHNSRGPPVVSATGI